MYNDRPKKRYKHMKNATSPVPHLTTVLTGPLLQVEKQILDNQTKIESWFRKQWRQTPAPFYTSVDIRNSRYKISPVDTNLFPAGFNNLNSDFEAICIQSIQLAVEQIGSNIDRILLIPENHTRNMYYMENVAILYSLINKAGFDVRIGALVTDDSDPSTISLDSGAELQLFPIVRDGDCVVIDDFKPELIVLNNDMSGGRPDILENISQFITPSLNLGWSSRLKSVHFGHYKTIASEFSEQIGIDSWLIDPLFRNCGEINFMKREGNTCLQSNVDALLIATQKKYDEYGVDQKPYVVVKADSGTYGMGVMMAHSAEEILELNRKDRTRMSKTKEGKKVTKVIIQEGVYTNETWGVDKMVAEPVVYMIGKNVVGGFYRVHAKKGSNENLNSPGMQFEPLAFDDCCVSPDIEKSPDAHSNRFYTYGVIARLANLAAARESVRR
jgi:glutamate--cysteine ligase